MKREVKKKKKEKRGKPTLFGVWRHLFHESDEVEQELGVVVGQFQIIAILPGEQTRHLHVKKTLPCNIYTLSHSHTALRDATQSEYAEAEVTLDTNVCGMRVLKSSWQKKRNKKNTADDLNATPRLIPVKE